MTESSQKQVKKNRLSLLALEPRLVFDVAIAAETATKLSTDAVLHLFDRTNTRTDTNANTLTLSHAQIDAQRQIAN